MNAVDQGDVPGDRARDFVRGDEMAEPLKGFQQDQKADSHRRAVSKRVGQVEFIGFPSPKPHPDIKCLTLVSYNSS